MPRTGGFAVAWQKYSSVMCAGFSQLQQNAEFVDMTIAADGHFVRVHQMIVGLASPYLKELVRSSPTPHPVVFLNNVSYRVLCCILEYVYTGEVIVPADDLRSFIEIGKSLHIRGLEDMHSHATAQQTKEDDYGQTEAQEEHETYEVEATEPDAGDRIIKSNVELIKAQVYKTGTLASKVHSGKMVKVIALPKKRDMPHIHDIPAKIPKIYTKTTTEEDPEITIAHDDSAVIQEEYLDTEELNLSTEEPAPSQKTDIMFTVSNMGGLQLILNRYLYRIRSIYKDGRRRWQCVDENKKCRAQAITKDDILISRTAMHNHPFHDKRILAKVKKNAVFASIEKAGHTISQEAIVESE